LTLDNFDPTGVRSLFQRAGVGSFRVGNGLSKSRFLTVQEVADLMRVSSMTVYRLIKAGELPAVRVGRSFRVSEPDVDAYLASRYTQAG
jgi:excisionase family DNA binding protein